MTQYFLSLIIGHAVMFSFTAAAVHAASENESVFITDRGAVFSYPKSWRVVTHDDLVQLIGPEKDIMIFIYTEKEYRDKDARARALWATIHPGRIFKTVLTAAFGRTWNWTSGERFMFDSAQVPGVIYEAYPHTVRGVTHWFFVEATIAAYSRRSADLSVILDSFRTVGMSTPSYAHKKSRILTDEEKVHLDDFVKSSMDKLKIPGCVFLVVNSVGQTLFEGAYGVKSVVTKEPIKIDTPFMIGSVTKALTSLMMARLVDMGIISWSTKLKEHLRGFKTGSVLLTDQLDIKTSVSASTGMPRRDMEFIFEYQETSPTDRIAELAFMKPTTKMGETFQYSNHLVLAGGYAAAAAYAKAVPLESAYERAMNELIFNPLGMRKTSIKRYDAQAVSGAMPHVLDIYNRQIELPVSREDALFSIAPAGGGSSTAPDLARYVLLELNKGVLGGARLLAEDAIMARRKPLIKASGSVHYGLGLFIEDFHGIKVVGHNGNTLGFSSSVFFLPNHGIGFVILTNVQGANSFMSVIMSKFLELTFDLPNRADEKLTRAVQSVQVRQDVLKKYLQSAEKGNAWIKKWVGTYQNPQLGKIVIRKKSDGAGYELDAGEWTSDLGMLMNESGVRSLMLLSPPFHLEFVPGKKARSLFMSTAQEVYEFTEQPKVQE